MKSIGFEQMSSWGPSPRQGCDTKRRIGKEKKKKKYFKKTKTHYKRKRERWHEKETAMFFQKKRMREERN
jgi:hypothetical protein